jgi:hypothetical protein
MAEPAGDKIGVRKECGARGGGNRRQFGASGRENFGRRYRGENVRYRVRDLVPRLAGAREEGREAGLVHIGYYKHLTARSRAVAYFQIRFRDAQESRYGFY